MNQRFVEDVSIDIAVCFYDYLQEHLQLGQSYNQFWETKGVAFQKIEACLKEIVNKKDETHSSDLIPTSEYLNFESAQFEIIKIIMKEINLQIDDTDKFFRNKLEFFISEYNKYQNDPLNYSFYTLKPLQTDKLELILQLKNETYKSKLAEGYLRDKELDTIKRVNTFLGLLDRSRSNDVIHKILEKYLETEFRPAFNEDRLKSYNSFFLDSNTKLYYSNIYKWESLRHYLQLNKPILGYYQAIREIREDIMILERLGYFEDKNLISTNKIKLKWNGKKNTLVDIFLQLSQLTNKKNEHLIDNSDNDIYRFIIDSFEGFENDNIETLRNYKKEEKRPKGNNKIEVIMRDEIN